MSRSITLGSLRIKNAGRHEPGKIMRLLKALAGRHAALVDGVTIHDLHEIAVYATSPERSELRTQARAKYFEVKFLVLRILKSKHGKTSAF
jgi:hypothetical protein